MTTHANAQGRDLSAGLAIDYLINRAESARGQPLPVARVVDALLDAVRAELPPAVRRRFDGERSALAAAIRAELTPEHRRSYDLERALERGPAFIMPTPVGLPS
jgi:hypothetical protein